MSGEDRVDTSGDCGGWRSGRLGLAGVPVYGGLDDITAAVKAFEADTVAVLVVKPGITGLWQVNGRSNLSWDESVRLDLRYVEDWSFALDLQILWKTISALLRLSGAH